MKKLTKKDYVTRLLAMEEVQKDKECVEFLKKELETLNNRKNGGTGEKAQKKIAEQTAYMNAIKEYLIDKPDGVTATEIMKNAEGLKDSNGDLLSIQKVSALLKKLGIKDGTGEVTKIEGNKKTGTLFMLTEYVKVDEVKAAD